MKETRTQKSAIPAVTLQAIDASALRSAEAAKSIGSTVRTKIVSFAVTEETSLAPHTHGAWTDVSDGRIWRLRIVGPGSTDLNLGFTDFFLPKGATLHVYDPVSGYFQGPYTADQNQSYRQLWTPVIPGNETVVEVFVPTSELGLLELELGQVGKGFLDVFNQGLSSLQKQGSCNIDVACPLGDGWRDEIRSVAVYGLNGSTFCTGTLINNVTQDFTPYFLTADHCNISSQNAPSVVVYWNFESPNCGDLDNGSLSQSTSGATLRAQNTDNDMSLLELSEQPNTLYNVYYAGWDASALSPTSSIAIHHPNTDEKAISFNDDALTTTDSCILFSQTISDTHWNVDNWEQGTTEPGSSGSGLFDPATQRLIGYLSGGSASCLNTAGNDCYGKFSVGWSNGLSTWLDPNNTGTLFVDGANPPSGPAIDETRVGDSRTLSSATLSEWFYGKTELPDGLSALTVSLTPVNGDPNLYTRANQLPDLSNYDCRPLAGGASAEVCAEENPPEGSHFWGINTSAAYTDAELQITGSVNPGDRVTGISESSTGFWTIYELSLPEAIDDFSITMDATGATGDPDLYVRYNAEPTLDNYDCRPFQASGISETCEITSPQAGIYYIGINPFSAYSNVVLTIGNSSDLLCFPIITVSTRIAVICI
ncbi:MAG: PPC domain-containing protein [Pseudomonadota bacterium]